MVGLGVLFGFILFGFVLFLFFPSWLLLVSFACGWLIGFLGFSVVCVLVGCFVCGLLFFFGSFQFFVPLFFFFLIFKLLY